MSDDELTRDECITALARELYPASWAAASESLFTAVVVRKARAEARAEAEEVLDAMYRAAVRSGRPMDFLAHALIPDSMIRRVDSDYGDNGSTA